MKTKAALKCWRDDSVVKDANCFCRGPRFDSQHLMVTHNCLQFQGYNNPVLHPWAPDMLVVHRHMCRKNTHKHIKMAVFKFLLWHQADCYMGKDFDF